MPHQFADMLKECLSEDGRFHHQGHVKLAWLHLRRYPLLEALSRFRLGLKYFAESHHEANKYHETLTIGYVLLIQERIAQQDPASWEAFVRQNLDLLDWKNPVLHRFYHSQTLESDQARVQFVLPDKLE